MRAIPTTTNASRWVAGTSTASHQVSVVYANEMPSTNSAPIMPRPCSRTSRAKFIYTTTSLRVGQDGESERLELFL